VESGAGSGNGSRRIKILWVLLPVLVAVCAAGAFFAWRAHETAEFFRPESLFRRFPSGDATAVGIDFAALRQAGLLSDSRAPLEPEYKAFLDGTGFDYRRDLDYAAASFSPGGNYFIARGRFDWKKLRDYAVRQGGSCYQELCRMQGSQPGRHISFLPLRDDALGLAVGQDDLAASRLMNPQAWLSIKIPATPVWMSVPGSVLRGQDGASIPGGIRMMLSALVHADRVLITVGPGGSGMEARLETNCRTQDEARVLVSQLRSTTGLLKDSVARDPAVRDDDLARTLADGVFEQAGLRVTGRWPVSKSLIASLTAGF
jgi:hypothetical protein